MSRRILRILPLLAGLLAAGCRHTRESDQPEALWTPERGSQTATGKPAGAKPKGPATASGQPAVEALPDALARFRTKAAGKEETPFLSPAATWRFWVSRITTLRADGSARGAEILVRFRKDAVTVFRKGDSPDTWLLPKGLSFAGVPSYLLLLPDLTVRLYDREGKVVPTGREATVVVGKLSAPGEGAREFRLLVKGGGSFRSIESPG